MKYRGYQIVPSYFVGTNWKMLKDGSFVPRKPTKKDIEYYEIYNGDDDPEVHMRVGVEATVEECKKTINFWNRVDAGEFND